MIGIIYESSITQSRRAKNTGDGNSDVRYTNLQRPLSNNPPPQPATVLPQLTTYSLRSETLRRGCDLAAIGTIATFVLFGWPHQSPPPSRGIELVWLSRERCERLQSWRQQTPACGSRCS